MTRVDWRLAGSAWVAKPAWQTDPNCPGRMVVGGTSASTPFLAGVIGLAGNPAQCPNAADFLLACQ